ncbi:retropepsin-like aspartic protease family protein [Jannaschia donghaensis]|uniref:Clan AA aspartic protease n=1 Tax=Jannaschia donghaensis TaxID=420998 RepID=A0A0M6YIS1_9RHOB|nr:TIGR02281 family clan AA aspartic protease [Jannaschia donghaensis]CTQ50262.1 clan AA aspartic protease [Jannaschia donghaensis]
MTDDNTARLIYLGLFLLVIGGGFLISNRHRVGQVFQQGAIWFLIFLGVALAFGNWDRIQQTLLPTQTYVGGQDGMVIEVPRRFDGHYYMTLRINGELVDFVVDTGASDIVLSADDARAVGVDLRDLAYMGRAQTANGTIRTAQVFLDEVQVGETVDRDVRAIVGDGELGISLLGMSYLGGFGKIEIENDTLRLIR